MNFKLAAVSFIFRGSGRGFSLSCCPRNKRVTILDHVDEDYQNRRPVVFDHQRRRGGQTNGETVFPRL